MSLPPLDTFYAWVLLGLAATFSVPVACENMAGKEQRRLDALRLHQRTTDPGQREVIARGKVRGKTLVAQPLASPMGRSCLAWGYAVLADRTSGSGKNRKTARSRICNKEAASDLLLETPEGTSLEIKNLTLRNREHESKGPLTQDKIPCPGLTSTDRKNATFSEYCLQDGDVAEAWACREPGKDVLRPCNDRGDYIAAPPDEGPVGEQRKKVGLPLCGGTLWLLLGGAGLIFMLSERVVQSRRTRKEAP